MKNEIKQYLIDRIMDTDRGNCHGCEDDFEDCK